MIGAREPESVSALHAAPAHQHVLKGNIESVADMEAAGDVGRWYHDAVRVGIPSTLDGSYRLGTSMGETPGRDNSLPLSFGEAEQARGTAVLLDFLGERISLPG